MEITGGKSITMNSPMRGLPLTAGFVVLEKAVRFAEEIIAKYDRPEESMQFGETLVFLRNIKDELQRAEAVRNEYLLTVRLMIARQLVLTGRTEVQNREYSTTVERLIERMSADLRSYDPTAWGRLRELQRVIENDVRFAEAVTAETVGTEAGSTRLLRVDAASLIRVINEGIDREMSREITAAELFGPFSGGELVFRTRDLSVAGAVDTDAAGHGEGKLASDNREQHTAVGGEIKVSSDDYGYDRQNLVLREEAEHTDGISQAGVTQQTKAAAGAGIAADHAENDTSDSEPQTGKQGRRNSGKRGRGNSANTEAANADAAIASETGDSSRVSIRDNTATFGEHTGSTDVRSGMAGKEAVTADKVASADAVSAANAAEAGMTSDEGGTEDAIRAAEPVNVSSDDYRYETESMVHRESADDGGDTQSGIIPQQGTETTRGEASGREQTNASAAEAASGAVVAGGAARSGVAGVANGENVTSVAGVASGADIAGDAASTSRVGDMADASDINRERTTREDRTDEDNAIVGDAITVSSKDYAYDAGTMVLRDETGARGDDTTNTHFPQLTDTGRRASDSGKNTADQAAAAAERAGQSTPAGGEAATARSVSGIDSGGSDGSNERIVSERNDSSNSVTAAAGDEAVVGDAIQVSAGDYRYGFETFVHKENAEAGSEASSTAASELQSAGSRGGEPVRVSRAGDGITVSSGDDNVNISVNGDTLTVTHGSDSVRVPLEGSGEAARSTAAPSADDAGDAARGSAVDAASGNTDYRVSDLIYRNGSGTAEMPDNAIMMNSFLTEGAKYFAGLVGKRPMSALRAPAGMTTLGNSTMVTLPENAPDGAARGEAEYRDTAAQLSYARAHSGEPEQQARPTGSRASAPTTDMLVRQFGNLIEGADPTGLTEQSGSAAFAGDSSIQRSDTVIRELVTAVKSAAEKSAENSKMIEEIRKRQTEMESGTLKTSDMRVISDEVITRLRSELRFDRSRYSG